MDRHRYLIPALALLTVWRIALLPTQELAPIEALASFFAQHPQAWHLEMGPLTPWLIACSEWMLGHTELGVRIWAPILAFVSSVCLWRLARGAFDPTVASWAVVFLQVLPAFNVAAITMTPSLVSSTALLGFLLAFRIALHRVQNWHGAWWCSAASLLLAELADWRAALAWVCGFVFLRFSPRRRHHLRRPGWLLITAAAVLPLLLMTTWNAQHGWPHWYAGEAEPVWNGATNLLRWMLLVSPGLLSLTAWALSKAGSAAADHRMLLCFALPFLLLDLAWGPQEQWPSMGWTCGWAWAFVWLAQRTLDHVGISTQRKILMRTSIVLLAALQSVALMRSDTLRNLGIPWSLGTAAAKPNDYRHLFSADPAGRAIGWRNAASVLRSILEGLPSESPPFLLAERWELAVELDFALQTSAGIWQPAGHPRVHAVQSPVPSHPMSSHARYDAGLSSEQSYTGRMALFISDHAEADAPPAEVRRVFERWEPLSIVRIVHGGHRVRTLKFFACHRYRPPDL
jgi:4-amino-4-deoxy-L-arabinose transferase-like glycosyltransferase